MAGIARRVVLGTAVIATFAGCVAGREPPKSVESAKGTSLPPLVTGKLLEDRMAEASANVGSLPMNLVPTPDGQYVLSSSMGSRQELCAVRTSDGRGTGRLTFEVGPSKTPTHSNGLYYGIAATGDGTVYAAQGGHGSIIVAKLKSDGSLTQGDTIKMRDTDFPAGLALDGRGLLYVANNDPGSGGLGVFGTPASVAIIGTAQRTEVGRYDFNDSFAGTSNFPLCVAALKDGRKCYVASQRDGCVYVLDTHDPKQPKLAGKIASGAHPSGLVLTKDESRLFIANAHSDTIAIVSTGDDSITGTILLRPEIARDLPGATPLGLALSPDEKTLYAALGDMNAVGVIDVASATLRGYVPAGWYPTGVVASPDGKRVFVTNAKGNKTRLPNMKPGKNFNGHVSPLTLFEGNVATIEVPSSVALPALTQRVLDLNRLSTRYVKAENPLKNIGLQAGKITHVIYIVKENRTYDQILGDMPAGNGDKRLCLFGHDVTPNLHALASRFVLLDNFYDCGEVSGDGWVWTTQGHANEYSIKNVPYYYSHRGRDFDFEGVNAEYPTGGFPARGPDGKLLSEDPLFIEGGKPVTDVAEAPGGHIWDAAIKAKLTYRNYGFFMTNGLTRNGKLSIPDNYPASLALQPGGHDLEGVTDLDYRKFDLDYADSEAPQRFFDQTKEPKFLRPRREYGKDKLSCRYAEWNREFQLMLAKDPSGAAVPNFITIRMGNDHTMGANALKHTPRSMVADNDYGVGQIVQAVSHSSIWKSTAIVIVEDDAQNGPDHVDAHRSTCYVISPWIKAQSVDHSFQNTVSTLKTIECLLGLPPMSQYDAVATPIMDWDRSPTNAAPYTAIVPSKELIGERNSALSPDKIFTPEQRSMIEKSEKMDFTVADRAPADQLNQIIWQTVRGPGSVMPDSPHGPVLPVQPGAVKKIKDDDD